jgi:hypothetical protein
VNSTTIRGDPAIQSLSQVRIEAGTQKEVLAAVQKSFGLSHSFQGGVTNQAQHPCSKSVRFDHPLHIDYTVARKLAWRLEQHYRFAARWPHGCRARHGLMLPFKRSTVPITKGCGGFVGALTKLEQ